MVRILALKCTVLVELSLRGSHPISDFSSNLSSDAHFFAWLKSSLKQDTTETDSVCTVRVCNGSIWYNTVHCRKKRVKLKIRTVILAKI